MKFCSAENSPKRYMRVKRIRAYTYPAAVFYAGTLHTTVKNQFFCFHLIAVFVFTLNCCADSIINQDYTGVTGKCYMLHAHPMFCFQLLSHYLGLLLSSLR